MPTDKEYLSAQDRLAFHKLKRLYFKERLSSFDTTNPESKNDHFRGFYTIFWMVMLFYSIITFVYCYEQDGVILSSDTFRVMSKDSLALCIADILMIAQSFIVVPFAKLLMKGVIPYQPTGLIIQHVVQTLYFFGNLTWVIWRNWNYTQSLFFTSHTMVMLMKMHSYVELNGELATKYIKLQSLKKEIPEFIKEHKDTELKENEKLAELESEVEFLDNELVQGSTRYPSNLTYYNYIDFLLVPTLVYWMEYPRTASIRPRYLLEKTAATLGTFLLLYITTERYIYPVVFDSSKSDLRVIIEVIIPFQLNYMFIFYIVFECILNWFAEITRFADRNFYDDWWNSVSFDEYARKWNKPVHRWLLRHVYSNSIESYKISKKSAAFITFLFSSCLHELVMVMLTKKIRMFLFVFQMSQIPLISLGRQPFIRNNPVLGNILFWIGLFLGPPMLGIFYTRQAIYNDRLLPYF
ncbi:MBOAT, membrane-bound O-acyltransferase family-domain-containing protein [Pilobolus umbonatus]|nr:MBOAT, membrane-bound O-acyltransferase family-domain-containing protein [Pilobolus umbonatus]